MTTDERIFRRGRAGFFVGFFGAALGTLVLAYLAAFAASYFFPEWARRWPGTSIPQKTVVLLVGNSPVVLMALFLWPRRKPVALGILSYLILESALLMFMLLTAP
jgi:hypothetical protein